MAFLEGPWSEKHEELIKQELGMEPGLLERGVRDLRSMMAASPYLPEPDSVETNLLECFVRGTRMDKERARNKLEAYFLARTRCRDLYEHISLHVPPLSYTFKFMQIITLPKMTDEGYRVTIARVMPDYSDDIVDVGDIAKAMLVTGDARLHDETILAGDVFIWEVTHLRASAVAKGLGAVNTIRRAIYLAQAAYPQRMKRIHVVGARPFVSSLLQLIRSFVNEKVRQRYYIHAKIEELLEYFPLKILPVEWGGEEESLDSLARRWRNRIDELKDYLQNLNDVSNVPPPPEMDNDMYGTVGAFRKLDID